MHKELISSGSRFEAALGYSRAVVVDRTVYVSGTTGFDYTTMDIADDVAEQTRQALRNIGAALAQSGATLANVVRVRYLITDAADVPAIAPVLAQHFGAIRPAATMFVVGLIDARMKIEIEVTAVLPAADPPP